MTDEELKKAAENYIAPIENDEGLDYINFNGRDIKDAFIAGAKWQAERLLSGRPLPEDTVAFNKGVAEGKRLMMEEAEECGLYWDGVFLTIDLNMTALGYSEGDKVRIIVIPNTDEK